jgi:hypothetical protein
LDDKKFIWDLGRIHVDLIRYRSWPNASHETKLKYLMNCKTIITSVTAALVVLGIAGCASEKQEQAEMQSQAKISKEQAQQTALTKAPGGTIKEAELENENGKLIWSFDITGSPGVTEVNVDAITGDVVNTENESAADEAKEKK